MANLVSEGVVDKLVQNQYLHSNTENFVEVVNQQLDAFRKTQMNNELLIKIKERLETLINKTNVQMNSFYEDISNYYSSIGQTDKVINGRDSYSNGVYTPNGANEFSRKFLINSKNEKDVTDEQTILSIINSEASKKKLRDIYTVVNKTFMSEKVNLTNEKSDLINTLRNTFSKQLFKNVANMTYAGIERNINRIFRSTRNKGQYGLNISNIKNTENQKYTNNIIEGLGLKDFSGRRQKDLNEFKNLLINKLKNVDLFRTIGLQYWDEWLSPEFKNRTGKKLDGRKRTKFARFFSETMSRYNVNLIDVNQDHSLNGFLLEYGLYASVNLPAKYGQEIVKILGQESVIRNYITEQYDDKGNLLKGTKEINGQSPSDIEYIGSSGKRYRFQLKNNFNEVSTALSFRSQAEIKVSTYLATAFDNVDVDIKNILAYLLINTAFLRNYGLGPYNSGTEINLSPKSFPIVRDYILFFLQQSYQFLIGYQYEKQIKEVEGITAGNLAYIFKGKYLIPVSAYFFSALEMLQKVLNNNYNLNGIGGIAGLPSFKKVSIPGKTNTEFQKEKINLLSKLKYNDSVYGEYKYPQGLLEYGGNYGRQIYNNLTFERISIVLVIEKLEKYFK